MKQKSRTHALRYADPLRSSDMGSVRSFTSGGRLPRGWILLSCRLDLFHIGYRAGECEVEGNFCGHRDRLAIFDEGLELPFLRCIQCGSSQNGVSTDGFDACHVARFRNRKLDPDLPLQLLLPRFLGVCGLLYLDGLQLCGICWCGKSSLVRSRFLVGILSVLRLSSLCLRVATLGRRRTGLCPDRGAGKKHQQHWSAQDRHLGVGFYRKILPAPLLNARYSAQR